MALGFNSPEILFLNTWDEPERNYLYPIFQKLRQRGYTRFVEPCAGAFVMPSIAVEGGWPRAQMLMSDVSLFSSLMGYTFMGKPLDDLEIRVDGEPIAMADGVTVARQAATVLYRQLVLRMDRRPELPYWDELRHDLSEREAAHIADIERHILRLDERMHGVQYVPKDIWQHVEDVADDPHTVISVNPPTYKGGFEKFYDTGGRLTWKEPAYDVFDAQVDVYRLLEQMQGRAALILCQQQQEPGKAGHWPVYARHLSLGQYVYVCANRPTEVLELAGGMKVMPLKGKDIQRLDVPTIPKDHEITAASTLTVMAVTDKEATYYRDLWMHKLDYRSAGYYVAVVLDGFLAGMIGYDAAPIYRPYPGAGDNVKGALLLTFAVGAPHTRRLTRLTTMVALSKDTLTKVLRPDLAVLIERIITVELTKYPEAKGLRGLMTLMRRPDPKYGNRLVYGTAATTQALTAIPGIWRRKEDAWQKERQKQLV
jgi:hypothetical protein